MDNRDIYGLEGAEEIQEKFDDLKEDIREYTNFTEFELFNNPDFVKGYKLGTEYLHIKSKKWIEIYWEKFVSFLEDQYALLYATTSVMLVCVALMLATNIYIKSLETNKVIGTTIAAFSLLLFVGVSFFSAYRSQKFRNKSIRRARKFNKEE